MEAVPVFNPASPQAQAIADLFYTVLIICGVILLIITGIITYSLVRFRHRAGNPEPPQTTGDQRLEFAWTLVPFLLVVLMFVLTAQAMHRSDPVPSDLNPDLVIIGHQWWWEARYPHSGAVTANEIYIPTGKPLLLRLESADVIHDFWVPQLSRKMDVVPGQPNHIWLQANQPGTYQGMCAEFCGVQHAWMRFVVVAQPVAEFDRWQQRQLDAAPKPGSPKASRGAELFLKTTCANCHAVKGTAASAQVAPDLTHLSERKTLAGGVVSNTATELTRWLRNPQSIKPGTLMPNLQLTEGQVSDLVSYLLTTGKAGEN